MPAPQIGDEVVVRYRLPKERLHGLVVQGAARREETAVGRLGAEMSGDELVGIVVEGDGSAVSIPRGAVVSVEPLR